MINYWISVKICQFFFNQSPASVIIFVNTRIREIIYHGSIANSNANKNKQVNNNISINPTPTSFKKKLFWFGLVKIK